jgi:hypothetical protein
MFVKKALPGDMCAVHQKFYLKWSRLVEWKATSSSAFPRAFPWHFPPNATINWNKDCFKLFGARMLGHRIGSKDAIHMNMLLKRKITHTSNSFL